MARVIAPNDGHIERRDRRFIASLGACPESLTTLTSFAADVLQIRDESASDSCWSEASEADGSVLLVATGHERDRSSKPVGSAPRAEQERINDYNPFANSYFGYTVDRAARPEIYSPTRPSRSLYQIMAVTVKTHAGRLLVGTQIDPTRRCGVRPTTGAQPRIPGIETLRPVRACQDVVGGISMRLGVTVACRLRALVGLGSVVGLQGCRGPAVGP
jgi:hypothetical protein